MATLELALLGRPEIYLDGKSLASLVSNKSRAMLFYLAVTRQTHSRQAVAGLLWGDMSEERARNNLRVELTKLRALAGTHLVVYRQTLAFNRESSHRVDASLFEAHLQRPEPTLIQLQEAIELYRGDFLEDFYVRDAPLFEDWVRAQRERLRKLALDALYRLATYHTQQQEYTIAIAHVRHLLRLEPWLEEAHRHLMTLLALNGQRSAALAQYEVCCNVLAEELAVEPAAATRALYRQILQGEIGADAEDKVLRLSSVVVPVSLAPPFQAPAQLPHFVGREQELATLAEQLAQSQGAKIVALTGMGGIGKTSVATHLAHRLHTHFVDGVLWANAATSEPLVILESWAQAFGYDFTNLPDLESRAAAFRGLLAEKKVLLVLDDVVSVARVRPLLPGGATCAVLLTTRDSDLARALNARVISLAELTPANGRQLLINILGEARAMAEVEAADEICALLHNLPLAVEITAQRLASRPRRRLIDMAARLRDVKSRLTELAISDREVRTSFEVSWEILDVNLRQVFALLGVFGGRAFTAAALAHVAILDIYTAEDRLFSLTALSLVAEEGGAYYRQHPLLADFAREKLGDAPDDYGHMAAGRMAAYYHLFARQHQHDYDALRPEWDNLMAGMQLAYEQSLGAVVIAYAETLTEAWFARGRFTAARRGYQWAHEAAMAAKDEAAVASSLLKWGEACIEQNDYDEAEKLLSESLRLYHRLADLACTATIHYHLARIATEQAKYDEAERLLTESRRVKEQLGDVVGVAATLYRQARVYYRRGAYEDAERIGRDALRLQEAENDKSGTLRTLRLLAGVAIARKEPHSAELYCQQALSLCEELQDQGELATVLYTLSAVYRLQDQWNMAQNHAARSLELFQRMGDRRSQALALYQLSIINEDMREYGQALEDCLQSLALFRELRDYSGIAHDLLHLGDLFAHLEKPAQAREPWHEALLIARELDHPVLVNSLQARLAKNEAS